MTLRKDVTQRNNESAKESHMLYNYVAFSVDDGSSIRSYWI